MNVCSYVPRLALAGTLGLLAGCASDQLAPLPPPVSAPLGAVTPRFAFLNVNDASSPSYPEAALGADPHPSNAGLWLGYDVTPGNCFRDLDPGDIQGRADNDKDWMYDDCEFKIASGFRPFLFSDNVCMGGEPTYAVKSYYHPPQTVRYVRILYMLSYYEDCGYISTMEEGAGPGDGERVQINIVYDGTSHWLFHSFNLSDHGNFPYYDFIEGHPFSPRVSYGGQTSDHYTRRYPNVWVSHGKHANFVDEDQCEAFFGSLSPDRCVSNGVGRVFISPTRNVGEVRWDGSKSPMDSTNPNSCFSGGHQGYATTEECYLQDKQFNGWYPNGPTGDGPSYFKDLKNQYSFEEEVPFGPNPPPPIVVISGPNMLVPWQSYTWSAQVNGVPPFSYQWYVDGVPAGNSSSISRYFPPEETHQLKVVVGAADNTSKTTLLVVQTQSECGEEWCGQFSMQGGSPAIGETRTTVATLERKAVKK